ncbi:MAG: hypothetical protein JKY01_07970 [Pseudomonadales bacterium]|nr:hypothetical protein [Pseudomonadales bacterium]
MNVSCNCGSFEIEWNTIEPSLVARVCGCDYCSSQKSEYVSDSSSVVTFKVADSSTQNVVTHGHGTAKFHECKNCGVIIVTSEIDGDLYCVINAKALDIKGYTLDLSVKNYSTESVSQRLLRRKNNWSKAIVCS